MPWLGLDSVQSAMRAAMGWIQSGGGPYFAHLWCRVMIRGWSRYTGTRLAGVQKSSGRGKLRTEVGYLDSYTMWLKYGISLSMPVLILNKCGLTLATCLVHPNSPNEVYGNTHMSKTY